MVLTTVQLVVDGQYVIQLWMVSTSVTVVDGQIINGVRQSYLKNKGLIYEVQQPNCSLENYTCALYEISPKFWYNYPVRVQSLQVQEFHFTL